MHHIEKGLKITISTRTLWRIALFGGLVVALILLKEFVLVVLTSLVLASFVRSFAGRLKKHGIPRTVSIVTIYVAGAVLLIGLFYALVPIIASEIGAIIPKLASFIPQKDTLDALQDANSFAEKLTASNGLTHTLGNVEQFVGSLSQGLYSTVVSLFGSIANIVLVLVFSFYLSVDVHSIENFIRTVVPLEHEDYALSLWHRSQRKIAYWLSGQIVLGCIVGVLTYIGLKILGVPYPFLLAALAGIFEMIPFGIFLAAVPALIAAAGEGGISLAAFTALLFFVIQQLEGYLIVPLVVRRFTGVSPLMVVIAIVMGATLLGFWGLVLAIPVTVTLLEYLADKEQEKIQARLSRDSSDRQQDITLIT